MNTSEILNQLYRHYQLTTEGWSTWLDELSARLVELNDARRKLADLKNEVQLYQHSAIMAETHKEGRINGSNAEIRKRQTELLLADLPNEDPDYGELAYALEQQQLRVDKLECEVEIIRQRISLLRGQARMIAGLTNALSG